MSSDCHGPGNQNNEVPERVVRKVQSPGKLRDLTYCTSTLLTKSHLSNFSKSRFFKVVEDGSRCGEVKAPWAITSATTKDDVVVQGNPRTNRTDLTLINAASRFEHWKEWQFSSLASIPSFSSCGERKVK